MVLVNSLGSDFEIIIPMSSAKRTALARPAVVLGKSFIYKVKNTGPRVEPCGMPYLVGSHFE
jgi:hypothetical protein